MRVQWTSNFMMKTCGPLKEQPDIALKWNSHCVLGLVFALYWKLFLVISALKLLVPQSCSKIDVSKSALLILTVVYHRRRPLFFVNAKTITSYLHLSLWRIVHPPVSVTQTHGAFTRLYKYFLHYIQYLKYKVDCIVTVQNIASFSLFSLGFLQVS